MIIFSNSKEFLTKDTSLKYLKGDKFKIVGNKLKRPLDSFIDFNAIAKGYAVDEIANFLKNNQIDNYLVEIGGEINASGTNVNKNKPWVIVMPLTNLIQHAMHGLHIRPHF